MSTRSTIDAACDFCGTALDRVIYIPQKSRRGAEVALCGKCGLLQTLYGRPETERISTLSCDADWGNVRHGKGVRFDAAREALAGVDWSGMSQVLDVGSNRGDFVRWVNRLHPHLSIHAVEPDARVVGSYRDDDAFEMSISRLEDLVLDAARYDFVYCSHTLEHAASASGMLTQISHALVPGGLLFLEVPNIAALRLEDTVEEFFIDKHTFHFDRAGLVDYVEHLGFEVLSAEDDNDIYNVSLLVKRANPPNATPYSPAVEVELAAKKALLATYADILAANRRKLKQLVDNLIIPFVARQKVAFWGAARIFDALVKYGGLSSNQVGCLVDSHLWSIVGQTHGTPIRKPDYLKRYEPQVVIVLARSAATHIANDVRSLGIRHVVKFQDLLSQCR